MKNKRQTAMQELLSQLYEERTNMPMPNEWEHCFRSIELVIEKHYLDIEMKQIIEAWDLSRRDIDYPANGNDYYNKNFKK